MGAIRITTETDNAIRVVYFLALENGKIGAFELSQKTGIPIRFLTKILRKLMISQIVYSIKGAHGGYMLAKKPSDITVISVINSIYGNININKCLCDDYKCTRPDINDNKQCALNNFFDNVNTEINEMLSKKTFDMFLNKN